MAIRAVIGAAAGVGLPVMLTPLRPMHVGRYPPDTSLIKVTKPKHDRGSIPLCKAILAILGITIQVALVWLGSLEYFGSGTQPLRLPFLALGLYVLGFLKRASLSYFYSLFLARRHHVEIVYYCSTLN